MDRDIELLEQYRPRNLLEVLFLHTKSKEKNGYSYIPLLAAHKELAISSLYFGINVNTINEISQILGLPRVELEVESKNLYETFSTGHLIRFLEKKFDNIVSNEDIEHISSILRSRRDSFIKFMHRISNMENFVDELFLWRPGLVHCDIISVFLSLFPPKVFFKKLKNYLAECILFGTSYNMYFHEHIKSKFSMAYFDKLDVMILDQKYFESVTSDTLTTRIISNEYWCEHDASTSENRNIEFLERYGLSPSFKHKNLICEFKPCCSWVSLLINDEKEVNVPFDVYLDVLSNKCTISEYLELTEEIRKENQELTM